MGGGATEKGIHPQTFEYPHSSGVVTTKRLRANCIFLFVISRNNNKKKNVKSPAAAATRARAREQTRGGARHGAYHGAGRLVGVQTQRRPLSAGRVSLATPAKRARPRRAQRAYVYASGTSHHTDGEKKKRIVHRHRSTPPAFCTVREHRPGII